MDKYIFILFSACGADETDITHYATVNKSKLLYSLFFVFTRLSQTFPFCGFIKSRDKRSGGIPRTAQEERSSLPVY